ncbi:hypothetical protein VCRA2122O12_320029 [Vibrio crassostreae]|nr:hypothetical protein VCRA2114E5_280029 [Vibrio crassostreae]CAK1991339.1 hypothetical protein VCRA2110O1_300030 [Vibrio crassostreae]CAK1994968.1 hypothetical protein VCRA2110O4_310030 [Vibrio crassostreae]CAK2783529.1 hypothetical protein VCRA2110O3_300030 [Vibrio crassostreae]CAK2799274.1 hypothetical protein VCRA2110O2_300028 [Vibrio crassostreae]
METGQIPANTTLKKIKINTFKTNNNNDLNKQTQA